MGKKLLAIAALALIVLLAVLWRQLDKSEAAAPTVVKAPAVAVAPAVIAPTAAPSEAKQVEDEGPPPEPAPTGKYDPQSDEFFFKHDEVVIPNVMKQAVKCWEKLDPAVRAKFHRNQNIVINFKQKIVNGTVTMYDTKVERSTIKDAALEDCFVKSVVATTWHDDKLPDWDQEDQIKISPRNLKKYTQENINYVGAEAPATPTYLTKEQIKADFDPNYKE